MADVVCSKCGRPKPLTTFVVDKRKKTGYRTYCKQCKNKYNRTWYDRDRENNNRKSRLWRKNNPEKARAISQRRYQKDKDLVKARNTSWQRRNKARWDAYRRKYMQAWRRDNPEKARTRDRNWRVNNPLKVRERKLRERARRLAAPVAATPEQLRLIKSICAGTDSAVKKKCCWVCWLINRVLTPATARDHVIPLTRGGPHCAENMRWICRRHNSQKHNKMPDAYLAQLRATTQRDAE